MRSSPRREEKATEQSWRDIGRKERCRTSRHGKFYQMVEAGNREKTGVSDRKIKSRPSTTGARSWQT
jgi:hypothetical protein